MVGLGNVENTALSTWSGTNKITTLGTITTGTWQGSKIANTYLANSTITINGKSTSLGESFNTASITSGTAGTSSATSGLSISIPYVTLNAYGIATAYGTHTHSISTANITAAIGSTTYAPWHADGYLPLSGGTMKGNIVLNNNISINGKTKDDTVYSLIKVSTANNIVVGSTSNTNNTNICGTTIQFYAPTSVVAKFTSTGLGVTGAVTASGLGTFDTITLTNTSAAAHINFSRASWNYLNAPTGGAVCVSIGGAGSANTIFAANADGIRPGATATYDLGTSAVRWNNIYGTNGDLAGTLNVASTSTFGDTITVANRKYLNWYGVDGTTAYNVLGVNNSDELLVGYGMRAANKTTVYGNPVNINVNGTNVVSVTATGLSVTGDADLSGTITMNAGNAIRWINSSSTSCTVISLGSGDNVYLGYGASAQGSNMQIYGATIPFYTSTARTLTATLNSTGFIPGANNTYNLGYVDSTTSNNRLWANIYGEHVELVRTGGETLTLRGTSLNNQTHTILFRGNSGDSNGFKIETTPASSYGRQSLGFYISNVSSGGAPYTPVWKRVLYMPYTGGVTIGTSSVSQDLTVYGNIYATGQVTAGTASDIALKDDIRKLNTDFA
ncbi:MAG: hypothetical protein IJ193_08370, partial [Bacilli bacterium]|nr:hypothetical protein [Bacilli bacterium]